MASSSRAVDSLEAGIYTALNTSLDDHGRVINWIRDTSIAYIDKIKQLFTYASLASIVLLTRDLFDALNGRAVFLNSSYRWYKIGAGSVGLLAIGYFGGRWLTPEAVPETRNVEGRGAVKITESISDTTFQTTKLILNISLACFSKNRLLPLLSATALSYTIFKNLNIKWIVVSREIINNNQSSRIGKLRITYSQMMINPGKQTEDGCKECAKEDEPKIVFCDSHAYHTSCITDWLAERIFHIRPYDLKKTVTTKYRNGVYDGNEISWSATVDDKDLPKCPHPECEKPALKSDLGIVVYEGSDVYPASLKINNNSDRA